MTKARPIGLVDIGSNSVVLVIARADTSGWCVLERVKHSAQLGACIDPSGALSVRGITRLRTALTDLITKVQHWNVPFRVTATASLRNVTNGQAIANELGSELGCVVEILSDAEEAAASFLGVWDCEQRPNDPLVVVDVGGGSSEVAWGTTGEMSGWLSLPLGGVRLSAVQGHADPVADAHVQDMRQVIDDHLDVLTTTAPPSPIAYACSGSIRRLCALADLDDEVLSRSELDRLVGRLEHARLRAERLAMPGMDKDRVDVLLPAALLHQAMAHRYGWDAYRLSRGGLRWGLLCGAVQAN